MDGEASMDELRELEQLMMNFPEDSYKIDIVNTYLQKKSTAGVFDEEETLAWEKHNELMHHSFPEEFAEESPEDSPYHQSFSSRFKRSNLVLLAILLLLISGATWFFYQSHTAAPVSKDTSLAQLSNGDNLPHPSKTKRILPDGTQVWLNGNSHISYQDDFGKNEKREVVLIGEAFFDVTHNARVPFIVHAKSINITVRGTAFNVRAYPEDKNVETSLLRGVVEVSTKADPKRKFILKPSEKINISVGSDIENKQSKSDRKPLVENDYDNDSYSIDKLQPDSRTKIIPEVSWLQDKLMFNSEPLSEIVEKMQRWYGSTIEIKDDRLKDLRFTGAFSSETLHQALSELQATYPFEITMGNNAVVLSIK